MNINVNSGDGNSIFDIAHQYQKMQIRELMKNPEEIRQRIKDVSDTGSSKFIEEFDKVNNLLFQLKTKTNFKIEDVADKRNHEIDRLAQINGIDKQAYEALFTNTKKTDLDYFVRSIKDIDNTMLSEIIQENQIVFVSIMLKVLKGILVPAKYQKDAIKRLEPLMAGFDTSLIPPEAVSTEAYSKLAGVSDTIPNIISQVLSITSKIKSELSIKYMQWEKEIDQLKMTNLVEQAKTTQITYMGLSEMKAIVDYNHIYIKIEKPLGATVELILRMASGIGITGSSDEMRFEELKKVKKITPAIQVKIKDGIE